MKNLLYVMVFQVLVGIWLMISPFVMGFKEITSMTVNDLVFGAIVAIIGIAGALTDVLVLRHAEKKP
jgi:multisubunit Na+/H+ antiporter MnhE subunit